MRATPICEKGVSRARNEFRLTRGCPRGEREIGDEARPGAVHEPRECRLPVLVEKIFVASQRHTILKGVNGIKAAKSMILAKFGGRSALDDILKYVMLSASSVERI